MDNPETMVGGVHKTHDKISSEKTEGTIMNGQSRDNGSTGYTRHRTNKCQRKPKNQSGMENPETMVALGTQGTGQISFRENDGLIRNRHSRDNGSTGYTRHRTNTRQRKPKDQ